MPQETGNKGTFYVLQYQQQTAESIFTLLCPIQQRKLWRAQKLKQTGSSVLYYCNSTATRQITLISWTIETNPGPSTSEEKSNPIITNKVKKKPAPKCQFCDRPCKCNQHRLLCDMFRVKTCSLRFAL